MIDFWLATGLLLLIALSFLLIPILGDRRVQQEEDRTALNVALYQERVAVLQAQHDEGVLTAQQMESARAEAARELLADTEGVAPTPVSRLGKPLPLLAALLVPVLGLGLYLHFGASDKVELTREFAQAPQSMEDMTLRLERAVAAQPDSAEGLYLGPGADRRGTQGRSQGSHQPGSAGDRRVRSSALPGGDRLLATSVGATAGR